jgi:SAM-dependent methyltransferase
MTTESARPPSAGATPATTTTTTTTDAASPDSAKVEAFARQLTRVLNGGALSLMLNIGHRTRLFDVMADLPPSTSEQIAQAAGLNDRYVREWLGAMVTRRIVELDGAGSTYILPPEHAALLTRAAGPDNLAALYQDIVQYALVQAQIIDCFYHGGGVPYSAFPDFQRNMAETSNPIRDTTLVQRTLPLVSGLVGRLQAGIAAADIGCGAGHAVNVMAKAFPNSHFTGYDISAEGIATARAEAAEWALTNARFEEQDVALLDAPAAYDLITTFDAIHDQVKPAEVLAAVARALRPGGTYLMVDIAASSYQHENLDHPLGPYLYAASCHHCMTVSLAQGGAGLGTVWGEQMAVRMLREAGFAQVEVKRIEGDILNNYYIASKEQAE